MSRIVLLLLCATACATEPRSERAPMRTPDDFPIVLAHGLSGFRTLSGIEYFFRVPGRLKERGHRVYVTHVPPFGSVQARAEQLARQVAMVLRRSRSQKVHVIAHSMGGLDARYMISKLGFGDRVATLTTVGTPHRGSLIADGYAAVNLPPTHLLQDFGADFWVWTLGGIKVHSDTASVAKDLSVQFSSVFNKDVTDDPRVRYYSFAGRTSGHDGKGFCEDGAWPNPDEVDWAPPVLMGTALVLNGPDIRNPVANDGMVQVPSARWGTFMGCVPADHMKEVGQPMIVAAFPGRWDHVAFFERWADELVSGKARSYGTH